MSPLPSKTTPEPRPAGVSTKTTLGATDRTTRTNWDCNAVAASAAAASWGAAGDAAVAAAPFAACGAGGAPLTGRLAGRGAAGCREQPPARGNETASASSRRRGCGRAGGGPPQRQIDLFVSRITPLRDRVLGLVRPRVVRRRAPQLRRQ